MNLVDNYQKGARIWIPHNENVWEGAKVTENFAKDVLKITTDNGEVKELVVASEQDLPPLRNPDILIGENDLTSLSYLHEPAVLYNLQVRFCRQNVIYTYCGIVLVAINPYCELSIYDPGTIWAYRGQAMGDLDPHIFAVAEEAFTNIEREQRNQSIIVSGESGAGKTVSAKYAMRYFATVGGSSTETHVEKKVLASSPIMEAIGNAKTTRNDNSSRFGKYIELQFGKDYKIIGASMRTYLLEKSRVVFQSQGERNYHIFYQICAAKDQLKNLHLDKADNFTYLCDPDSTIPGINENDQFLETLSALKTLNFNADDINDIFTILASVLHLGNVQFLEGGGHDGESCTINQNDTYLTYFSNLLDIDISEIRNWLCHRKIVSLRESIIKPMTSIQAYSARDALAKHIYECLFAWIVNRINNALNLSKDLKQAFIGVLDIYGFETFEVNSFEQFCINYANEKLQQQFNMHVFKLEQEEYLKEGIEWKFIDFYDNQPCIDLIEAKLGILDLLDEECKMPKGSDSSWADKLYEKCKKWQHFVKPKFGSNSFLLKHFADKVEYDVSGFLEKNRDTVIEEQITVLKTSGNQLIQKLFNGQPDDSKLAVPKPRARVTITARSQPTQSATKHKKTVGSQFRDSLNALMTTLNSTTPHYIRCIKPNDEKEAFRYNPKRAVQQLRACGVLETIRISAAGFPSRWLYIDFLKRYKSLTHSKNVNREDYQGTCTVILNEVIKDADKFKFGKTKIFFRAGQVAYLERIRSEKLLQSCIKIQTAVRGFLARRRYTKTLTATNTLQRYFRGYWARKRVLEMRRNKAACIIQKWLKRWLAQVQFKRIKTSVLGLQKYARGYLARKKYQLMRQNKAAVIIQKNERRWMCRLKYRRTLKKIILAQATIRRFLARRRYKKMKREARSAENLKKLNKGLENKIISLQQKIGELEKENSYQKSVAQELVEMKAKIDAMRGIEVQLKSAKTELFKKDKHLEEVAVEIENLKKIIKENENEVTKWSVKEKEWIIEIERLKNENNKLNDGLNNAQLEKEEEIRSRINEELQHTENERKDERTAHQKLLAEKLVLESRLESLERSYGKNHKRNSSDASSISIQDDDIGYASVRSTASSREEIIVTPEQQAHYNLIIKLQKKIKGLETERRHLLERATEKNANTGNNSFMVEELEFENSRLRSDLLTLREAVSIDNSGSKAKQEITKQAEFWQGEAKRAREEASNLREALGKRVSSTSNLARSSYPAADIDPSVINEDGELVLAFEAQKKALRQLEDEIQYKTMKFDVEREELVNELNRLMAENENKSAVLAGTAGIDPALEIPYYYAEINRVVSENLNLHEKYDAKLAKCLLLQQQVNDLTKMLKEAGIPDVNKIIQQRRESRPTIKKKEREEYMGMFKCKFEDTAVLIKHTLELKPHVAIALLPGLPAYILFMVVRYIDHINDDNMVQDLIFNYINGVRKTIKKKGCEIKTGILWLANTLRFVHNLKQYSGEKHFGKDNTQKQNEQCLKNFDLMELRQIICDEAIVVCQFIIKKLQTIIQPYVVPAILEHEAISGLTGPVRARSSSVTTQNNPKKSMETLLFILGDFKRSLDAHGVDPQLHSQFFVQIFYYLCATSLNNLLLRKEYCNWSRGMQIRYNISHLEQWLREDTKIVEMLHPIIQASQFLQARKKESDIDSLIEMCTELSPNQIMKLVNLYTPIDSYDEISESFITEIQNKLKPGMHSENILMMDAHKQFTLEFPFNPSNIRLEDIEIPDALYLPMLTKI